MSVEPGKWGVIYNPKALKGTETMERNQGVHGQQRCQL